MELRDYIEIGIKKFGSVQALADAIGLDRSSLSLAKSHKRGIPAYGIAKLSEVLAIDPKIITAASELVTERNEAKRAYWLPFVTNAPNMTQLAKFALILTVVGSIASPTPSEAAQNKEVTQEAFCIM